MSPYALVGAGLLAATLLLCSLWLIQLRTRDAGIADVGWTAALGLLAGSYAAGLADGLAGRRWLVAGLVIAWSARLTWHLLRDRVFPAGEDGRYRALRSKWGERASARLLVLFVAQAVAASLLSLSYLPAMLHPVSTLRWTDAVGVAIWLLAIGGESLADRQLARFRARTENRGLTCREGLWKYSRHPNYFFEWLHWWTYVIMALGSRSWWLSLVGPTTMLWFILRVTGIPPTEEQALRSRGRDYQRYQEETSAFFPWKPRAR